MMEAEYKQMIRDLIYLRESDGRPIFEIADKIEKLMREVVESEMRGRV